MILARKSGWLIAVKVVSETDTYIEVLEIGKSESIIICKTPNIELFDNVADAVEWIRFSEATE